jgi:tetratricopeptide (TPR) repeat protein
VKEASERFMEGIELGQQQDPLFEAISQGFQGIVALKWTGIEQGMQLLASCIDGLRKYSTTRWDEFAFLHSYGAFYEIKNNLELAEQTYRECLSMRQFERWYWHAGALTGLVRVHYLKGEYHAIASVMQEAETLAQRYEYNDHLASLRTIQGHLALESQVVGEEQRFETALSFYKQALVYALRYNRFLLDEVLSGRPHGTPLQPIIPHCVKRGKEGVRMLHSLRDWWESELNNLDVPRPDGVSPIPAGILLVECERQARREELGDGTVQETVLEQLDKYL